MPLSTLIHCLLTVLALTLTSCEPSQPDPGQTASPKQNSSDLIDITGTVKYIDLEGGFYGIVGPDGTHYEVVGLKKTFQIDGLKVRFRAEELHGISSAQQWGLIVKITHIEKIQ